MHGPAAPHITMLLPVIITFIVTSTPIVIDVPPAIPYDATTTLRLAAVRTELVTQGVPELYFAGLLADPRAKVYPKPSSTAPAPVQKVDWAAVRRNLMKSSSIAAGKKFIAAHRAALTNAQARYGVSREAITAVLRVETNLGTITGTTPVFSVFLTGLANTVTARGVKSYGDNLAALARYCHESGADCLALKGSYAGALGWPQFLPKSLMIWGVDGDGDGKVDLFDPADAIPSAANFLQSHGWGNTTKSRAAALGRYYGSSVGYPYATLDYGEALKVKSKAASAR